MAVEPALRTMVFIATRAYSKDSTSVAKGKSVKSQNTNATKSSSPQNHSKPNKNRPTVPVNSSREMVFVFFLIIFLVIFKFNFISFRIHQQMNQKTRMKPFMKIMHYQLHEKRFKSLLLQKKYLFFIFYFFSYF